jgi:hypothetical protein
MTSTSPAFSACMLRPMVWSVTRVMLAGSMPASRRSCCRHSHGVGTSLTVASLTDFRSASVKPACGGWRPISRKGSRPTTSPKQTMSQPGIC